MATNTVYRASSAEVCDLFSDYLDGDGSRPALVLSAAVADAAAKNAIEKSLEAFNYPFNSCTYVTIFPHDRSIEGGDVAIDAESLFLLVEGIDPLCLFALDRQSCELLAAAYRLKLDVNSSTRVFGRPSALFDDLSQLVTTPTGKQTAWKLFKRTLSSPR